MYTHTRLYIGRQILGHYIDTPPLLFAIALHDSIICMREKEHCLKPVTIHIPQLYIINPEKPDAPLYKNDAFQKVQKRRVPEKR